MTIRQELLYRSNRQGFPAIVPMENRQLFSSSGEKVYTSITERCLFNLSATYRALYLRNDFRLYVLKINAILTFRFIFIYLKFCIEPFACLGFKPANGLGMPLFDKFFYLFLTQLSTCNFANIKITS